MVCSPSTISRSFTCRRGIHAQALSAGDAISWTPSLASGFYLHGEGQVGMLHPLHLLLYSALPFAAAFNLDIIFNYGFALAGGVLLLRRFGMSAPAAWLGGLLIAFSGFNLMHLLHVNAIAVAAHLPWLMLTAELVVMAKSGIERMAGAIGVALVLGSAFLMGFPQCVLLSAIAVAAYVSGASLEPRRTTGDADMSRPRWHGSRRRLLAALASARCSSCRPWMSRPLLCGTTYPPDSR